MEFYFLSTIFVFLAGVFDAAQTGARDNPELTSLYRWISKFKNYEKKMQWLEWYFENGGNIRWNPSLPSIPFLNIWYSGAWHTFKHCWIICLSIAIGLAALSNLNLWQAVILAFTANFVEGTTFQLFYATIFRIDVKFNFLQFLKERNPFYNSHK